MRLIESWVPWKAPRGRASNVCRYVYTVIHEDDYGAIAMAMNNDREGMQNGAIVVKYVATDEMIADTLTKPLPKHRFEKLVTEPGMRTVK